MQGLNPLTMQCTYSTPCGWCTKWDKKCDKKVPERGLRAKCNFIEDAIDSTDAMNVISRATNEIKLLENILDSEKIPQSAYDNFRKNVCAYCSDQQECLRSNIDIFECLKDENWEDWV